MSTNLPPASLAADLLLAVRVVTAILHGQSLASGLLSGVPTARRPAVQDMVYGSLRQFGRGDARLQALLDKPLTSDDVRALLLLALYRLDTWPDSEHTVVDQAVAAAGVLVQGRCRGLVNAVLRNYLRRRAELDVAIAAQPEAHFQHPDWWIARLQADHPAQWQEILAAGNSVPPMALRVNRRRVERAVYREHLAQAGIGADLRGEDGLLLHQAVPVEALPHFAEGWVSVQDIGAQRAAELLSPQAGTQVLDACAAPGGKTAHLLERTDLDLLALDLKASRCRRIEENLTRLGLTARIQVADAGQVDAWWDGRLFDAVLADVPCTASGVVRRHPDAKFLRRSADVASFAATQAVLLARLWPLLRPGGKLLYATCSVFAEENGLQMQRFCAAFPDALVAHEEQWLPQSWHDGFYYCLLNKQAN